jgi:hypothetical protein
MTARQPWPRAPVPLEDYAAELDGLFSALSHLRVHMCGNKGVPLQHKSGIGRARKRRTGSTRPHAANAALRGPRWRGASPIATERRGGQRSWHSRTTGRVVGCGPWSRRLTAPHCPGSPHGTFRAGIHRSPRLCGSMGWRSGWRKATSG